MSALIGECLGFYLAHFDDMEVFHSLEERPEGVAGEDWERVKRVESLALGQAERILGLGGEALSLAVSPVARLKRSSRPATVRTRWNWAGKLIPKGRQNEVGWAGLALERDHGGSLFFWIALRGQGRARALLLEERLRRPDWPEVVAADPPWISGTTLLSRLSISRRSRDSEAVELAKATGAFLVQNWRSVLEILEA